MKILTPINICNVHFDNVYEIFKQNIYSFVLVGITLDAVFVKSEASKNVYEFKWSGSSYEWCGYRLYIDTENQVIMK